MASIEVTIQPDDIRIATEPGELLLDIALEAGVPVLSECGGHGECGSCRVEVQSGCIRRLNRDGAEEEITSPTTVLACQTEAVEDVVMRIPDESRLVSAGASVVGYIHPVAAEFVGPPRRGFPLAERQWVELEPPSFDDPTCDWERLVADLQKDDFEGREFTAHLEMLRDLPDMMRENDFHIVATLADCGCHHEVIDIAAPRPKDALGLVVDLGTSNVKAELVDLATGRVLVDGTAVNAQTRYGEDVISRIIYTQEHEDGADRLQEAIVNTVNGLIDSFVSSTGKRAEDIIAVSCDGNATMISLRFRIPPDTIRRAPHIAPTCRPPIVPGEDLDLNTHPRASVFCTPAINGYIGGDISAGILATGLFDAEELTLLIDVGTNGEIVLGNRDWITCCSCSAGPAFEGMGIQCGLPARPGAIDAVEYDAETDEVSVHTIEDRPPLGVCGNGFVETLADLVEGGVIDRAGNINSDSPSERVRSVDGNLEFVLVWSDESGTDSDIALRQAEIDNLIRAKAAVYAGVVTLLNQLGLSTEMIERLYLAGAFGEHLDIKAAVKIGLLPDMPPERVTVAGNTALMGSYITLLSSEAREQVKSIARSATYVDLSTSNDFMEEFVSAQMLPHTDLELFPSVENSIHQ